MAFADWNTTANLNITVGGINIAEACPPSNLNNAIREMMAELRGAINPALDPFNAATTLALARTALGALGTAGGTVTDNIVRDSAGPHLFHDNPAFTSGRIRFTAPGASDPTNKAGDIWITGS